MNSLTKRRLNSLDPYLQKFYEKIPEGDYTTKELARKLGRNHTSVASMLTHLRRKGLIYSVQCEDNARAWIHTKLVEADKRPQGVIKKKSKHNGHVHPHTGGRTADEGAIAALFDTINENLVTLEQAMINLVRENQDVDELRTKIEKVLG